MTPRKPEYPNVACAVPGHENPEPGYAVCIHVLNDERPVFDVERATPKRLGVVACERCFSASKLEEALCVCSHCAAVRGWIKRELN